MEIKTSGRFMIVVCVNISPFFFRKPEEKLAAMQEALDEIIAKSQPVISGADPLQPDVAAYLEVIPKAPHLLQSESDPRFERTVIPSPPPVDDSSPTGPNA
jgi:hypothetical protein